MADEEDVRVNVRGNCGHEFQVRIDNVDLSQLEFSCPECGETDRFSQKQIAMLGGDTDGLRVPSWAKGNRRLKTKGG